MSDQCPCGEKETVNNLQACGPHAGSRRCARCNRFIKRLSKADVAGYRTEAEIQGEIIAKIGQMRGVRIWRQNVGLARTLDGGRVVRFGVPGQADISGLLHTGRRLEIEVKNDKGKQTKEQKAFQQMIAAMGGLYVLARNVEDVIVALAEAGIHE